MTVYGGAAMVFGELLDWDPSGKVSLVEATFDAVRSQGRGLVAVGCAAESFKHQKPPGS